uniref:Gastrula zinc finger protein XlCGF58.1 n=1 Tax=Lygus hesperus TaxID=30085 RepID=A0A146KKG1_LYGHE
MEGGEEVTSTSENDTKVSPREEPAIVDSSKKLAEVPVGDAEGNPTEDTMASTQGPNVCSNDVADSSVTSTELGDIATIAETDDDVPRLRSSTELDDIAVIAESPPRTSTDLGDIATIAEVSDDTPPLPSSSDVAIKDSLVKEGSSLPTSSEQSGETGEPRVVSKTQPLAISSPTVSATSTSCPIEQTPVLTCTRTENPELSVESLQITNRSDIAKKEAILLVEKLALNTSITVSRKESKPESSKAESVPEGRVLRLRPTPKPDPPKPSPKPTPKPSEGRKTSTSSNSGGDKSSNKTPKGQKRKHDDSEGDLYDKGNSVPIQYKGYKKVVTVREPVKKSIIKFNPFNPAFRRECTRVPSQVMCSNFDSPQQDQQEYAQYLGLQPLVKFRCSNCGMSSFQTMNALNAHKAECTKTIGVTNQGQSMKLPFSTGHLDSSQTEPKSANIKLTRKVFLCSACGTYYELWNLFLHMREAHRRYICLECLGMSSSPEKLSEHLKQKHGVISQTFDDPEKFSPSILPQAYYLMCIHCDKIYSEEDKFTSHKCPGKKAEAEGSATSAKNQVVSSQTQTSEPPKSAPEAVQTAPNSSAKLPLRRTREATKKATKLAQQKKEVDAVKAVTQKEVEETIQEPSIPAAGPAELVTPDPEQSGEFVHPTEPEDKSMPETVAEVKKEHDPSESNIPPTPTSSIQVSEAISSDTGKNLESSTPLEESLGSNANESTIGDVKPEAMVTPHPYIVPSEPTVALPDVASSILPEHPVVAPFIPGKAKNIKRGARKPARRKRPLTLKPRSRKPKHVPVPVQMLNPSGLLPNPLNSIHFNPSEQTESQSMGRVPDSDQTSSAVDAPKEPSQEFMNKLPLQFKLKLNPDMDTEGDSDDSQKLSLVVDESANNSDAETKSVGQKDGYEESAELQNLEVEDSKEVAEPVDRITLAGDDIQPMALALEDKIENVPIQAVLKECVRTSCLSCNYCRHAHKIAVNGKYLALHLLSEHRYLPIKNETPDDVISKLKNSLDELENMCFNTETYDNTDVSIHVPYDQDTTFDCFQCNYACGTHKDLFAHKRKFHSKPLLLCIMCKTNFFSYSEMLCHLCPGHYTEEIMFHNVHINYRCCFCRLDSIPSAFRLMVHLRKSHHTCDICLESCADQQKLSTHLWKHKVNHLCYRCGISYASKPDITKHLFWKHGHESVLCKKCLQKKWPHVYHFCIPPTSFICEECSASFSKAVALKVHKRLHVEEFPYSCSECEKKFISRKLLDRHVERHRNIEFDTNVDNDEPICPEDDQKDEIINVTDVVDTKEEVEGEANDSKDEVKEKTHKKHRKDKKDKVVDPYDLPPLNLSSESDSSDEDESPKKTEIEDSKSEPSSETPVTNDVNAGKGDVAEVSEPQVVEDPPVMVPKPETDITAPVISHELSGAITESENPERQEIKLPSGKDNIDKSGNDAPNDLERDYQVEGIWENFYKTNPTNHNLPYPLCAMKSEVAYGIIMGDHDYCMQVKTDPVIKDDLPSNSNLETGFMEDNMEEENINSEKPVDPVTPGEEKKKGKSPKKRLKTPNDNSSSSSDSSSDSDSSSCTCGTNCSCSSSSSNSSSSSSSDSDSSGGEDKTKQERRKKKKERKVKSKSEIPQEVPKEAENPPEENVPRIPVDPPIQESELETDESSTDEEFYDKQPGKIANQIIAEKRNQLILSVATPNNGSGTNSPQPETLPLPPKDNNTPVSKSRSKEKKRRKLLTKTKPPPEQHSQLSLSLQTPPVNQFLPDYTNDQTPKPSFPMYNTASPSVLPYQNTTPSVSTTPSNSIPPSPAGMSENDKSRSSKRRRIPNKFYGYSSGDEDEKPTPQKWRKPQDLTPSIPRMPMPPQPSPTPRIQLTVPKQVIRKPSYHKVQKTPKITIAPPIPPSPLPPPPPPSVVLHPPLPLQRPLPDSSETDSDTDLSNQPQSSFIPPPMPPPPPPPPPPPSEPSSSGKPEKDVYCYCRCPYDEVSEMIACDDESCPIEWFHFECVGILVPPRGQWYCPGCRKARGLPT